MKFLDKITSRFANKASCAVKKEVKKTVIDLIPGILAIGAAVAGIFIFKEVVEVPSEVVPTFTTHVVNNYFFRDVSEESIKKLMEGR